MAPDLNVPLDAPAAPEKSADETINQARMVNADGCTEIQGYLVSRPVPADEVTALLARDPGAVLTL